MPVTCVAYIQAPSSTGSFRFEWHFAYSGPVVLLGFRFEFVVYIHAPSFYRELQNWRDIVYIQALLFYWELDLNLLCIFRPRRFTGNWRFVPSETVRKRVGLLYHLDLRPLQTRKTELGQTLWEHVCFSSKHCCLLVNIRNIKFCIVP